MPTLSWIGKEAVENHHNEVPFRLLKRNNKFSVGEADSGNLLVQGDNLEALKALLPYYAGQVKCIYIDPPYNTGNQSWIYNDNVNSPEMKDWLGKVVGREGEDLSRSDKWLCMMYPRLNLLRQFLKEDGVIFISIDEVERDHLRIMLDEIFIRRNRVGTIVWKNATDNNPTRIVPEHEYVLCYAKDISKLLNQWKAQSIATKAKMIEKEKELCSNFSEPKKLQSNYTKWFRENRPYIWPFQDYKFIDKDGIFTGMRSVHNPGKEGYRYDVIHPKTRKPCQQPMMGYRYPPETMNKLLEDNRIIFGKDEHKIIELKVYVKDYRSKLSSVFELDGRRGTNEVKAIFPESKRPFDFPKPTGLIEELLAFTTQEDDIILDSFAGSGTTGHAVFNLNKQENSKRRFILVEMDNDICQNITCERIKRIIQVNDSDRKNCLVSGFNYCELGQTLFNAEGQIRDEVSYNDLARHIYFCETGEPLPKTIRDNSPLLGIHKEVGIYLLYNGILKDKTVNGGNVLISKILAELPKHEGKKVIYGTACRLSEKRLRSEQIVFKQTPYEIRIS